MFDQDNYLNTDCTAALETEGLQTDIHRFMAIMGFCLMAIFALVQSIPVTEPEDEQESARLQAELAYQKRQFKEEKRHQAQKLVQYQSIIQKRDQKIQALTVAKDRVKEKLDAAWNAEKRDMDNPTAPRKPHKHGSASNKGLYVAFLSDGVFMDLLRAGKIDLFIKITDMETGFKVLNKDGHIDFRPGLPAPGLDLWEVEADIVAPEILTAFKTWTTLASREKLFIVGLKPEISKPIRTRKERGGRFMIGPGGTVTYTPYKN